MARKEVEDRPERIEFRTKEMEAYLAVGYGMDLAKANLIIKEREAKPELWPYEMYEKAKAFIEAYNGKPMP